MIDIPGYKITQKISLGTNVGIYRAISLNDALPVIIKAAIEKPQKDKIVSKLKREYHIASQINSAYIVKYLDIVKFDENLGVILEDINGTALSKVIPDNGFPLEVFLKIAISVTQSLIDTHNNNIIHNDIKPDNIIVTPDYMQCKLIDFGSSTQLRQVSKAPVSFYQAEGTLAYISPEQTGRINRKVDYRTDFYSLGITLYQLLCGVLPFAAKGTAQLIHQHIASTPVAPCEIKHDIPSVISQIIMKLIMKNAEDRYQNGYQLLLDLQQCQKQLTEVGKINFFIIAENDFPRQLHIPQKLYGRKNEADMLLSAFHRVSEGKPEAFMVTGYSGVGKSYLVHEIQKPLALKKGYFISGKFDQLNRNIAYSAIIDAFRQLIKQILAEDEQKIAEWKGKFFSALGANGKVITDILPELEIIVGSMPAIEKLDPAQEKNRFIMVFQRFLSIFTKSEHPLALFLDDLQWADIGSLQLIESFMKSPETSYFLFVGAYRDNEVNESHPALIMLDHIKSFGITLQTVVLKPLDISNVNQIVADTLHHRPEFTRDLAQLIYNKTNGNPFFVRLFIQALYDNGVLTLSKNGWHWNQDAIASFPATDNVIQLMTSQLNLLAEDTRKTLSLASCLGNHFNLEDLKIITKLSQAKLLDALKPALDMQIIAPMNQYLQFAHDRVQEAAYALLADDEKIATHLIIGRALLEVQQGEIPQDKLFTIVDHLNHAADLIFNNDERTKICRLNLSAAYKAKAAAAYTAALTYLKAACGFWPIKEGWVKDYALTFTLRKELAENEFLCGNLVRSQKIIYETLPFTTTIIDKAELYNFLIIQEAFKGNYRKSAEIGCEALALFGIDLKPSTDQERIREESLQVKNMLEDIEIHTLANLPEMQDKNMQAAFKILYNLFAIGYLSEQSLLQMVVLKMVRISLEFGNVAESSMAYAGYGMLLCSTDINYLLGYKFGELSISLSEKYNNLVQKCRNLDIIAHGINHWARPLVDTIPLIEEAYRAGLASGELQYSGYLCMAKALTLYNMGLAFSAVKKELRALVEFGQATNNNAVFAWVNAVKLAIENLSGRTKEKFDFRIGDLSEEEFIANCRATSELSAICFFYINKAQVLYLYDELPSALNTLELAKPLFAYATGQYAIALHNWYHSLTLLGLYPTASTEAQKSYWQQLIANQVQMKHWAENCPANFLHKYNLVAAVMASLDNKPMEAIELYEKAVKGASSFIQERAIACELAGRFWLERDNTSCAFYYVNEAYQCYLSWGAIRKVEEYKVKHRGLLAPTNQLSQFTVDNTTTIDVENLKLLDLTSLLHASQSLSQEIDLAKLLRSIMQIAMQHAGAQKGALLLAGEHEGDLLVEAEYHPDRNITLLENISSSKWQRGALSIIQYVRRTRQVILLSDASSSEQFHTDPYLKHHEIQSLLCLPILKQNEFKGILYLENNLSKHAFAQHHVDILTILASQMAISLENAKRIDEKLKYARDLADQTARAQAAEMHKAEYERFTAYLSHEIRNPLFGISGHASLLKDSIKKINDALSEFGPSELSKTAEAVKKEMASLKESAAIISSCSEYITEMTNDVLTSAKLEAKKLQLIDTIFKPKDICKSVMKMFLAQADKAGLTLGLELPEEDFIVHGDASRLKQVLVNLVSNAIKFTKNGSILLKLEVVANNNSEVSLRFNVVDTGMGMEEESKSKLFLQFSQLHQRESQTNIGTGLGLFISKSLVELMHGDIEFTSEKDKGSTFYFTLSFPLAKEDEKRQLLQKTTANKSDEKLLDKKATVLIVEDDSIIQNILKKYLENAGHNVVLASDGNVALEIVKSAYRDNKVIDLILMDMYMPDKNGADTTLAIREEEEQLHRSPVPIYFLSGELPEDLKALALKCRANGFLSKPIKKSELINILSSIIAPSEAKIASPTEAYMNYSLWQKPEEIKPDSQEEKEVRKITPSNQ